jgi:lysophospholipid acyltransferase (LPLAT)-like uncharacterized protein
MTGPSDPETRPSLYQRVSRSQRRLTFWRRALYRAAVPVGLGIFRLWWLTCRVVRVVGAENLRTALASSPAVIPCYWHQHQLFCARYLLQQRSLGLKVGFLISPSVDGELGAMLVNRVGGYVIRGSSTSTGARALRDYYRALTAEQVSPVITPDGPRGPAFVFKPGAILLAQMSGRPIVPLAYAASRAWKVKWDRFVIPVPFARIAVAVGEPRQVPRTLDPAGLERWQRLLEADLRAAFAAARGALSRR